MLLGSKITVQNQGKNQNYGTTIKEGTKIDVQNYCTAGTKISGGGGWARGRCGGRYWRGGGSNSQGGLSIDAAPPTRPQCARHQNFQTEGNDSIDVGHPLRMDRVPIVALHYPDTRQEIEHFVRFSC